MGPLRVAARARSSMASQSSAEGLESEKCQLRLVPQGEEASLPSAFI